MKKWKEEYWNTSDLAGRVILLSQLTSFWFIVVPLFYFPWLYGVYTIIKKFTKP